MSFAKGIPMTDITMKKADIGSIRGTTVRFKPDPSIFKTTVDFEFDKLASRIDELAYLNAGLTIRLIDRRSKDMRNRYTLVNNKDDEDENVVASTSTSTPTASKSKLKPKILIKSDDDDDEIKGGTGHNSIVGSSEEESVLYDTTPVREEIYRHDGGIRELVEVLCQGKENLHPEVAVITVTEERKVRYLLIDCD